MPSDDKLQLDFLAEIKVHPQMAVCRLPDCHALLSYTDWLAMLALAVAGTCFWTCLLLRRWFKLIHHQSRGGWKNDAEGCQCHSYTRMYSSCRVCHGRQLTRSEKQDEGHFARVPHAHGWVLR